MEDANRLTHVELTTEIVAAYVEKNSLPRGELPGLIASLHAALSGLSQPLAEPTAAEPLRPAVPIKKSVTDDFIISLEDGRKMKTMKRYLAGLGMSPADYRQKWGLPADYPMVAPEYARKRGDLARAIGLGRKAAAVLPEAAPAEAEPVKAPAKKRGRAKAA